MASAGWDTKVILWDPTTGKKLLTYAGHGSAVRSVAIARVGIWAASGGAAPDEVSMGRKAGTEPPVARLWDTRTGEEKAVLRGHTGGVGCVAFSPNSLFVATASDDGTARVWGTNGEELRRFHGHRGPVLAVAWSADGRRLVTGGADTTVRVWDAETGKELAAYRGHTVPVRSVAFHPDGKRLVSGGGEWGRGGEVRVWDVTTPPESRPVSEPGCDRFALAPDGFTVFAVTGDSAALSDARTGRPLGARIPFPDPWRSARFLSAWTDPAAGPITVRDVAGVRRFDAATGKPAPTPVGKGESFEAASDDGSRLAVRADGADGFEVREMGTGRTVSRVSEPWASAFTLVMSPDGKRVAAPLPDPDSGEGERRLPRAVGVFDADTGAKVVEIPLRVEWGGAFEMALAPGGRALAVLTKDRVGLWAVPSGEPLGRFAIPERPLPWLRFTADGSAPLFHGGYREQCECVVWDVRTGRDRFRLRAGSDDTFAPSPDGSRLARGTPAGVFVLDAATGDEVLALRDAAGPVAWGGGGRWLLARGPDGSVRVFDGTPRP